MSLAAAVGSIGATLGPFIGAVFLLHSTDTSEATVRQLSPSQLTAYLNAEAQLVKVPYLSLGALFVVLGVLLFFVKMPDIQEEGEDRIRLKAIFNYKHTVLGALGVFCYLGAEVGIVSFLIRHSKSLEIDGLGEQKAALFITLFMALVLVGRLAGAYFLQKTNSSKALIACALGAIVLVTVAILSTGYVSIFSLSIVGLFTSVMYPILFTLSIKNLGAYTKTGSSLIIMSIVGGAIVPPLMGLISDMYSIRFAFVLPILCYAYILYYAQKGHIIR